LERRAISTACSTGSSRCVPGIGRGWVFGTYPIITDSQFLDAARTRAAAHVTVGYSGAAVLLEKANGVWKPSSLTAKWTT
jgi:hypothetical protein